MSEIFQEKIGTGIQPAVALEEAVQEVIDNGGSLERVETRLTDLASIAIEQRMPFEWLRIYEEKGVSDTLYGKDF